MSIRSSLLSKGALLWLLLANVVWAATPTTPVTLRVGVASQLGPDTWLKAAGLDQNLPYKIEWSYFVASPAGLEALRAGHIDIVMGGGQGVLNVATQPDAIAAVSAYRRTLFVGLIVPKSSPAKSVADLRGRKIAIYRAGGSHGTLLQILSKAGLGMADVTLVNLTPPDAMAAFSKGDVDAWMIWDPSVAIAQQKYGARVLAVPDANDIGQFGFHYANRKALQDPGKRTALIDYITRHVRSLEWLKQNPDKWAALQAQLSKIDPAAALLSAKRTGIEYMPIDASLVQQEQKFADLMVDLKVIPRKVDVHPAFDLNFNSQVTHALGAKTN